jgi:uncharacterized caspase-like protein
MEGHFLLVPHGADLSSAISDAELSGWFRDIDARRIIFIVDACQSGQAIESTDKRLGPMNSRSFVQLAYDKGLIILAASQSDGAAIEAAEYSHGLLTYALFREGLQESKAAREGQRDISARDWFSYATARVPELQKSYMASAAAKGTVVAIVPGEENLDVGRRATQRPRAFFRRDAAELSFPVSRLRTQATTR